MLESEDSGLTFDKKAPPFSDRLEEKDNAIKRTTKRIDLPREIKILALNIVFMAPH